jgi:hypothetical protein
MLDPRRSDESKVPLLHSTLEESIPRQPIEPLLQANRTIIENVTSKDLLGGCHVYLGRIVAATGGRALLQLSDFQWTLVPSRDLCSFHSSISPAVMVAGLTRC